MAQYQDLNLFANIDNQGKLIESNNEEAFKNSLLFFLTSNKGDLLLNPSAGGIINSLIFKKMDDNNINQIQDSLTSLIQEEFSPEISDVYVEVTPDYEKRLLIIEVRYINPLTQIADTLTIYTKDLSEVKTFIYVDIAFIEENLYNFVVTQLSSMQGEKLIFNAGFGLYTWGKYKFLNFDVNDSYFSQILALING